MQKKSWFGKVMAVVVAFGAMFVSLTILLSGIYVFLNWAAWLSWFVGPSLVIVGLIAMLAVALATISVFVEIG